MCLVDGRAFFRQLLRSVLNLFYKTLGVLCEFLFHVFARYCYVSTDDGGGGGGGGGACFVE